MHDFHLIIDNNVHFYYRDKIDYQQLRLFDNTTFAFTVASRSIPKIAELKINSGNL